MLLRDSKNCTKFNLKLKNIKKNSTIIKILVFNLLSLILLTLNAEQPLFKRGDYCPGFITKDKKLINWFSKFDMVEMGGIDDPAGKRTIGLLKTNRVKTILAYDWMPAIYYYIDGENNPFSIYIYKNRYELTLNPYGPFPHADEMGYFFLRDYYLDLLNEKVVEKRVQFELNFLKQYGYNGLFFDWGAGVFIDNLQYKQIKDNFKFKHPEKDYADSVENFYKKLKKRLKPYNYTPFSNQGYRNAKYVLPYVNYDMAESYITGYDYFGKVLDVESYGKIEIPQTQYFPVSINGEESFEDTLYYLDMINKLIKKYKSNDFKRFIFLNYAAPDFVYNSKTKKYKPSQPKDALFLSFAAAKLINQTSYLEVTFDRSLDFNQIYFINLGKAYGDNYIKNNREKYVVRFFENGLILVYYGEEKTVNLKIKNCCAPKDASFYDFYSKKWLKANENFISIHIETKKDPLTDKTIPAGRVILYLKERKEFPKHFKIHFN